MTLAAVIQRSKADREAWRYTDLKRLDGVVYNSAVPVEMEVPRESRSPRIVFINGIWSPEQSNLNDLPPDIMRGDSANGYQLLIADQTCLITSPLELLFITKASAEPVEADTKLHIMLGVSGRLTLIERHITVTTALAMNFVHTIQIEISLAPQAKLVHGKIVKNGEDSAHLATTEALLDKGAYYDNFTLLCDGRLTRNEINVTLDGEQAQCNLSGAMLLRDGNHADTAIRVTHNAAYGISRQSYRSVVDDKARGVFQGKISVAPNAQKTDGHQISRALLLSDQAEMDAKPELEINADDVKCSHGSAIGALDENAMFYLQSRGIPEAEARALLITAFVAELVDGIQVDELRHAVENEVDGWLIGQT